MFSNFQNTAYGVGKLPAALIFFAFKPRDKKFENKKNGYFKIGKFKL